MKYKNTLLFSEILLTAYLLSACAFITGEIDVEIILPALPDSWSGFSQALFFRVEYSENGERRCGGVVAPGETVSIRLPRIRNSVVLAYPLFLPSEAPEGGMRPAAGIYPRAFERDSSDRRSFILSWEEGFAGECLMILSCETCRSEGVNTRRLIEEIDEVSKGDPWFLDMKKLLRPMVYGRFYGGFISPAPVYPVELPEEKTEWVSGDPLLDLNKCLERDEENGQAGILLPEGFHRFIAPGGSEWIDIMVSEAEIIYLESSID